VDLLNRDFGSLIPGSILVGDITYVATREGRLYVATVIDLATRQVLGYATSNRQTTQLIVRAMTAARTSGLIVTGAVFHGEAGQDEVKHHPSRALADGCVGRHGMSVPGCAVRAGLSKQVSAVTGRRQRSHDDVGRSLPGVHFSLIVSKGSQ